ncbi:Pimeloyl-ACP methyl ester carboxylesterase [Glycomyces sambucus]|uniref:Pimeloyl-ACP methyl ester carboxylesterase n=1 Tax=Glycomyces sambucus TaxID=380244 RepID=A0A1G9MG29_9ACTN|nr:alpha/beta hydrolase [Glycomyces sambucus]SDL72625.1 Pimeloyl-ACP methyl ester carboxylesterase [Glycomyces sambucus]
MEDTRIRHRHADIAGHRLMYREAGRPDAPTALVLLHGFPSSSQMFRDLMEPMAATGVRVLAPDLPGFGLSSLPAPDTEYGFTWLADVVEAWLAALGVEDRILFLHDFGAAVGYHLATRSPETVRGLVVQNGNAHEDGLGEQWDASRAYWADPTEENRGKIDTWMTYEGTRHQYLWGMPDRLAELVPPETWELDWRAISRDHGLDLQWKLFTDYRSHVARFGEIRDYHREHRPEALIIWGVHDPFFNLDEVPAFRRSLPHAESHLLDAGHYLLETHSRECADLMRPFVSRIAG